MENKFIKILNPDIAEKLADSGFSYVKERSAYVFIYNDELVALLTQKYAETQFAKTSKLTF